MKIHKILFVLMMTAVIMISSLSFAEEKDTCKDNADGTTTINPDGPMPQHQGTGYGSCKSQGYGPR